MRLKTERDRTELRLAALTRDFAAIVESVAMSPPDDEHDPEGATTAFERQQLAALIDRAREHLVDVDRAGERLRDGTYGGCARCGRPIAPARLEARPTATTCVACASTPARVSARR